MKSVTLPALEARFSRQPKVRFFYRLGSEFAGFELAEARQWVSR